MINLSAHTFEVLKDIINHNKILVHDMCCGYYFYKYKCSQCMCNVSVK